ncbi:ABC transporter substrate binding protein [uncultured Draconibacterium sp.]|uniref:ABC transporter substrate binding protein n=1 Tax=uncultured Draconibacterium sp. TaxID=1573823 RepID=UPI0025F9625E|nr:ABC transporter substrate binding protein [uncultured Draconibacterium sp.]
MNTLQKIPSQQTTAMGSTPFLRNFLLLLFFSLLMAVSALAGSKHVLLISSYNSGFPTFFQQVEGIKSVLDDKNVVLDIECMDSKRFFTAESNRLFKELLQYKLANTFPYDAIITTDDNALNFVVDNQDSLFAGIPVVFCGVNDIAVALNQNSNPLVTGVVEAVSLKETVKIMVNLFPDTKTVYAIVDGTSSGQGDLKTYYKVAETMPNVEFKEIALHKTTYNSYKQQLQAIPEETPVLLLSAYFDSTGQVVDFGQCMQLLNENLKAPLFHLWEHGLGDGVLGGKIISHHEQGKFAATILQGMWLGEKIEEIAVNSTSPNRLMFDYEQLVRFGITERTLPNKSIIINKPVSFITKYKAFLGWFLAIIVVLTAFILVLSYSFFKQQRIKRILVQQNKDFEALNKKHLKQNEQLSAAQIQLEENEKRFWHLFENNPVSLWEEDFTELISCVKQVPCAYEDLPKYLDDNPGFVQKCAEAVTITEINKATLKLFGAKNKNDLKNNLSVTFNKKSLETFKKLLVALANNKLRFIQETEYVSLSGERIFAILYVFTFEKLSKSIVAIVDTTIIKQTQEELSNKLSELQQSEQELKSINEQLVAAKDQAEESDRLKSAFLANMSHEIRTPMNGIMGFAELLSEPQLETELQQSYISIIQKSGERMLATINDIIDISKIHAGQVKVNFEQIDIVEELQTVYEFFKPEATSKNIDFRMQQHIPEAYKLVYTDKTKLDSVFNNLLKNAIKYTDKGQINLQATVNNENYTFVVKDTGIGIPENRLEAIFERFVQADIADENAKEGAGLGLAITQSYVSMLGGKIKVKSKPGFGSEFTVEIPFKRPSHKKENPLPKSAENGQPIKNGKFNILIVDDDGVSVELLKVVLKPYAIRIMVGTNGPEAIEMAKNNNDIDLILMDIKMPDINGFEATRQIRAFNNSVKIIAQTAFARPEDSRKALAAGCNAFMAKPIVKEELLAQISKLFSLS